MPKVIKAEIDEEALDVLRRSEVTDKGIKLPEQLDRALYVKVDKVLKDHGAKWDRHAKVHVVKDARLFKGLREALADGEYTDERKTFQVFYTPPEVAEKLLAFAIQGFPVDSEIRRKRPLLSDLGAGIRVLEPSAGEGALVRVARQEWPNASISPRRASAAAPNGSRPSNGPDGPYRVVDTDFLALGPNYFGDAFDVILMNPPFSKGQAMEHIEHAMRFLAPGGVLAAICPEPLRKNFLPDFAAVWAPLPEGSFKEAGTGVRVGMLRVSK